MTRAAVRHYRPPGLAVWWRRRSLRARLTLTAAGGLAVALAAVAILLISALGVTLDRGLDNSARQTAREVAALVDANRLPNPVPVAAGTAVVQVINAQGRIVAASAGADRLVPLLPAAQAEAAARTQTGVPLDGRPYGLPESLRVAAVPGKRGEIVIAAVSYNAVNDTLVTVAHALLFGTPALLLLMIWASWLITGSTLRPITALRRGAEQVTATGVPRGLPVPEARDEVHSLAVTLNDMLSRLEAAQQRQRQFVSDTAHELRSPIASIRAQLEVALDHPRSQEWEQTARDVLADTMRLSRLAEDLLALARLEERGGRARGADPGGPESGAGDQPHDLDGPGSVTGGPGPDAGGPVDLAALATGTAGRYGQARVPVSASAPEPCPVAGDGEALRRMLVNLIDNAVRYAAEPGHRGGATGRWIGPGHRDRRRPGDRRLRHGARVRAVHDAGRRAGAPRRRCWRGRPRPGHRPGHGPRARRDRVAGGRPPGAAGHRPVAAGRAAASPGWSRQRLPGWAAG